MDISDLCTNCGLCCDGSLFSYVPLTSEDVGAARRVGLPIFDGEKGPAFAQPCCMHRDGMCTIYAERPGTCSRYRCALLKGIEEGSVLPDEATQRVAAVRALVRALLDRLEPSDKSLWYRIGQAAIDAERASVPSAWRAANADFLLDVGSLHLLILRHFEPKFGRTVEPMAG